MNKKNKQTIIDLVKSSKAFLFDMDGVITDTMPEHCKAWIDSFKKYFDVKIPRHEIYKREGEKSEISVKDILSQYSIHVTKKEIKEFLAFKASKFSEKKTIKLFPQILEFLKVLKRYKKLALVTGTQRIEINKRVPKRLTNIFDCIITSTDVKRGKPHPEPYKKALKSLKISPADALVIENAPYGIESAINAKIKVIALKTSLPSKYLKEADIIFNTHKEFYKFIMNTLH